MTALVRSPEVFGADSDNRWDWEAGGARRLSESSDVSVRAGVHQEYASAPDLPLARDRDGSGDSPALPGLVDEGDDRSQIWLRS